MSEGRGLRLLRALGWATLAAAPILLVALALVSSRPDAPPALVMEAAFAAWIAGALAFGASLMHRRAKRASRVTGIVAVIVVAGACGILAWSSIEHGHVVALDRTERRDLERREVDGEPRWVHPTLGVSFAASPGMHRAPAVAHDAEQAGGASWTSAHRVFAWEAPDTQIVADLSRAPAADRRAMSEVRDELARQLAQGGRVERAELTSATNAELEATVRGGGHALVRALLFRRGDRAYRLVVTVVTREPSRWTEWLRAVRVPD